MTESMDDFKKALDASFRSISEGDLVDCTVVGISDAEVTVDLQYSCAGIICRENMSADPAFSIRQDVQIGDTFKAEVLRLDDGRGNLLLSKKEADAAGAWQKFTDRLNSKAVTDMKISGAVKGGVIGFIDGSRIFVPASKLSLDYVEDLNAWVGKTIPVRMIMVDRGCGRLVASSRDVLREAAEKEKARLISNFRVGMITEGTVAALLPYGAFVSLGSGLDGLVHISQITSERRLKHPKEMLAVGDKVKVKVIAVRDGRISLSLKEASDELAEKISEEKVTVPESEKLTTSLGSLLKDIRLDQGDTGRENPAPPHL